MRIAFRSLLRHPGFAALSIGTLAAGLGLIAALASVADAIFFRPLPVARPGEVVRIFTATREQPLGFVSFPDFEDFRRDYPAVAQTQVLIAVGDPPRIRIGLAVTPDYFDVLGVAPASGRNFRPEDAGGAVVMLAYSFWRANPQAIGSTLRLGRTSFTVIGVAPKDFGLDRFIHEDYYVCTGAFAAGLLPVTGRPWEDRSRRFFSVYARVRGPIGVGRAKIAAIGSHLETEFPATNRGRRAVLITERDARMRSDRTMPALARALVVVALLLIAITAVNFAGLMMVRNQSRAREIATHVALGSTRVRLFRESIAETMLLAITAAAVGLLIGWAATQMLASVATLPTDFHFAIAPRIDARVALSIAVAAILCGAAAARSKPMAVRTRWRGALVTVEIALASLLIASDAMLLERIARTRNVDLGYRTEHVFVAVIDPAQAGYDEVRARAFYNELVDRVRHLRGVAGVALAQSVPLAYTGAQREIAIEGEAETLPVWMNVVTEDYFDLMHMRPLAGRVFDRRDTAASLPIAVVNQELAKRCGIGCSFRMNGHAVKVVGVVPTARYFQIGEAPRPFFYLPFSQNYASRTALHVDGGAPSEILNAIRQQDPGLPVSEARMLADYARQGAMFHARIASYTIGAVGIGGLILALAGLYGLVSCDAARRRREIGIRMALGAQRIVVVRVLFAKFFWRSLASASAGSAAAIACAPSLATVSGADNLKVWPAVISAGLVLVLSLCAGLIPAWRASGIDPALVLRQD